MPELNCSVSTCDHNSNNCCCINSINVAGSQAVSSSATCCNNFQEKSNAFTNDLKTPNFNIQVSCEASNCAHNLAHQCNAQHIDVAGGMANSCEETRCSSFICE
ncbi:MAG: DUF1540 domain-containing protein [Sarcina sp.]